MRETKYRAWDKYLKLYADINDKYSDTVLLASDGSIYLWSCDEGGCDLTKETDPRFDIQFYTGLKDKNGKEVYEGDIVRFDNSDIGGGLVVGEVTFNTDQTLSGLEWGLWTKGGYHKTDFLGEIKVIGNIYENPRLLGK